MNKDRQRFVAMLAAIGITLLVITAGLYLIVAGRDVEQTIGPIVGFASPLIITLFAYAGLGGQIDKVHSEVNGNTTQILDKNSELQQQLQDAHAELALLKGGEPQHENEHNH